MRVRRQVRQTGALFPGCRLRGGRSDEGQCDAFGSGCGAGRAAGLRSEAEAKSTAVLPFADASTIPGELARYIEWLVSRGIYQCDHSLPTSEFIIQLRRTRPTPITIDSKQGVSAVTSLDVR
jgi:hypothetical protein